MPWLKPDGALHLFGQPLDPTQVRAGHAMAADTVRRIPGCPLAHPAVSPASISVDDVSRSGFAGRVSRLRVERVDGDATVHDWQHVHNLVIPTHHRSADEVRERATYNVLEVAYLGETLIGCTTVRPPTSGAPMATVIARVLPGHRRRGFGTRLYERGLGQARELGAEVVDTVVLASNVEGLRFAQQRGFAEIDTYVLPGETIPWIDLRLGVHPVSG